jgi:hypothetical protein
VLFDGVTEICGESIAEYKGDCWVWFGWWAMRGLVATNPCAYFADFSDKGVISFRRCDLQSLPENVVFVK